MSRLLSRALREVPIGVLLLAHNDGVLVEMNEVSSNWFSIVLSLGDVIENKLQDVSGQPLNMLDNNEGNFRFGHLVYRYVWSELIDNGKKYLNVCIFDDTSAFLRLSNAEDIARLNKGQSLKTAPASLSVEENMEDFELKCSIDAGLGFSEDADATMVRYSATGVVVQCNKALRGFPPEEIIGVLAYDHIHPDDIAGVTTYHLGLLDDPRPIVPVYVWLRKKHKNGAYVHTEVIGAYHADENGERWISGVERVMSSERMEKMLSSVTDQLPCGVIGVEKKTGFVDILNPNAIDWLNLKQGQNFENHLESLRNTHFVDEECDKLIHTVKQCHLQPEGERNAEVTVKTTQGRVLTFLCSSKKTSSSSSPSSSSLSQKGTEGTPVDTRVDPILIWIVNDVTALSTAMEEKQRAILRFMRCTSHDMRTPMQAISLAAHSLSEGSNDARGDINTIMSSSAVLETIMSNILEFKTISSMKIIPTLNKVDIGGKLNRIVNMLKHSTLIVDQVKLSLEIDWEKEQEILIDDKKFDRIILNLVTNALKFTTNGYVKIIGSINNNNSSHKDIIQHSNKKLKSENNDKKIISKEEDEEEDEERNGEKNDNESMIENECPYLLRIEIIDTGCGMDETAQAHIGELEFFSGEAGGFGLGTFIVKSYIQALHGKLYVKSTVNEGTTMTVEIPIKLSENQIQSTSSSSIDDKEEPLCVERLPMVIPAVNLNQRKTTPPFTQRSKSEPTKEYSHGSDRKETKGMILVVEDVHVNRKLIVKSLQRGGFQVEQAENGAIGLEKMLQNEYQTVFMDINMPIMNGDIAVREYWKQRDVEKETYPKIVMLTGNITEADREMALACGAHEFMTKPVVPKQLWDAACWNMPPTNNSTRFLNKKDILLPKVMND